MSEDKDKSIAEQAADASTRISFSSFIMSMGMQALMQMGEMKAPDGTPVEKNLEAAQQSVDVLSVLREKTKGNLDSEEERLFEELLHNVRIAFVRSK